MARAVVFLLILLGISFYPLIEMKNVKKIKEYNIKYFVPTEILDGRYFVYEVNLSKKGKFSKLDIFSKKKIMAFNLEFNDLIKHESLKAKRALYNAPLLKAFNVLYKNKDYNLSTDFAFYNQKEKTLKGGKFKILSANYRGYGDSFFVDSNKNIFATDINYFLKVK